MRTAALLLAALMLVACDDDGAGTTETDVLDGTATQDVADAPTPVACTSDDPCPAGTVCEGGECVVQTCSEERPCSGLTVRRSCIDGVCHAAECGVEGKTCEDPGEYCDHGACVLGPPCPPPCEDGDISEHCNQDRLCDRGWVCNRGTDTCVPGANCGSEADCDLAQGCWQGMCTATECIDDFDCPERLCVDWVCGRDDVRPWE